MKVAIYVNEGTTQIVLTPENEWEKNALKMLNAGNVVQNFWGGVLRMSGWLVPRKSKPPREFNVPYREAAGSAK